jgi:hypothetical protein
VYGGICSGAKEDFGLQSTVWKQLHIVIFSAEIIIMSPLHLILKIKLIWGSMANAEKNDSLWEAGRRK